jgi:DNA repair ATPase RecN
VPDGTAARIFNVTELEQEIAEVIKSTPPVRAIDYAPPSVRLAAAAERDGAGEIGKLSAEAITREFEAAAKEVEAMGQELQEAARRCEAVVSGAHQAVAECRETAALIRDKGKHYSAQIEDVSAMTAEVRTTCSALKAKIAGPTE